MPIHEENSYGDLIVTFNVSIPARLTPTQHEAIKQVFNKS
jgi:DnaJ-class molecular chaperone